MSRQPVTVEQYIKAKGWRYQVNGNQAKIETCPFCKRTWKFSINVNNFLWDCKHASCSAFGGEGCNAWKLFRLLGDLDKYVWSGQQSSAHADIAGNSPATDMESIPDDDAVEDAHGRLMDDLKLVNYLTDEKWWSAETLIQMRVGLTVRWFAGIRQAAPALMFPYFENGVCTFAKFRTLPLPAHPKAFSALKGRPVPIYNADVIKPDMPYLILCEGESDTLTLLSAGERNVIGVPGAGIKKVTWGPRLSLPAKRYLLFDNDDAGKLGAQNFARQFADTLHLSFHIITLPAFDGKDISDWITGGHSLKWLHDETRKN